MAGATVKCCRFGASSVYTIHPCISLHCHFIQSHIGRVYACLAVTCHLHFWQNDGDLLHATAVTRGWNGYRNKSQHRKLTLEKNLLHGDSNPRPFSHESGALPLSYPVPHGSGGGGGGISAAGGGGEETYEKFGGGEG